MAYRVFQYPATFSTGTSASSPATVALPFTNYDLDAIGVDVPAGPAGHVGFYIANNGVPWFPYTGDWLIWDNHSDTWPVSDQPHAGGWAVVGYNTGAYPHTIRVRFHADPISADVASATPSSPNVTLLTCNVPEMTTVI